MYNNLIYFLYNFLNLVFTKVFTHSNTLESHITYAISSLSYFFSKEAIVSYLLSKGLFKKL